MGYIHIKHILIVDPSSLFYRCNGEPTTTHNKANSSPMELPEIRE